MCVGAILSSKAQSDAHLEQVRGEARKTIHILHKLQARFVKEVVSEHNDVMHKTICDLIGMFIMYIIRIYVYVGR